ncbi:MAG: branched-chain amino acid ABC transporter permease [Deltaproteobacteria bacterium]|nr:branched-chain amino acid ABC transporter permease [Deltaproteobacteria bacterium]
MAIFLQFIAGGLFFGGMYTLIALGIVIIYKSTKVFNFAQGWMVTLGAFMLVTLVEKFGVVAGVIAGLAFGALLGLGIDRLLMRPLIGQPLVAALLLTIMLAEVFEGINILAWGTFGYDMPVELPGESIKLGEVVISHALLWGIAVALVGFAAFSFFYWRTPIGRVMRATAEDHQVAQGLGLPVRGVFSLSWVLAGLLSVIAGLFLGVVSGVHYLMYGALLGALAVVLLGGLDSIAGAIVGGMILGVVQSLVTGYLSPALADVIPFIVLLLILIIKPYGLFGLVRIERL